MGRTGHISKLLQHPAFAQPVQHTRKRINMLTVRMLETVFAVPQRHTRLFQLTPVRRQTAREIRSRLYIYNKSFEFWEKCGFGAFVFISHY